MARALVVWVGVLAAATVATGTAVDATAHAPASHVSATVVLDPLVRSAFPWTSSAPPTSAMCLKRFKQACYDPAQLETAYGLTSLYAHGVEGKGETIVIVDPFGSPTITADLATFDAAFSLPAPPSLRVIHPVGTASAYSMTGVDRAGWASETTLDVEWAHAMAPRASLLVVDTPTDEVEGISGFPDIVRAERYVIAHKLGDVISQSFGATESTFASRSQVMSLRSAYLAAERAGVTVLAATGDLGATSLLSNAVSISTARAIDWPSSDPLVTAVGGTKLDLNASGHRLRPDVAWNDTYAMTPPYPNASGGGRSIYFARPAYQDSVASVTKAARGVPDISMSAACSAGVDIYESFPERGGAGWHVICGTSEATPLFAGIVALADEEAGHGLGLINPALYAMASTRDSGIVPVTAGNNTVAFKGEGETITVVGFSSTKGYSLVTGLGTIDAAQFVPALVRAVAAHPGAT